MVHDNRDANEVCILLFNRFWIIFRNQLGNQGLRFLYVVPFYSEKICSNI